MNSVPADIDWTDRAIKIEFQAGRSARECGCIEILDDNVPEGTESFFIELKSSVPGVVVAEPAHAVVEIEDDDDGKTKKPMLGSIANISYVLTGENTTLMFTNDTPNVIGNSVMAEFVVGKSFVSVSCDCTTRLQKDCEFYFLT